MSKRLETEFAGVKFKNPVPLHLVHADLEKK